MLELVAPKVGGVEGQRRQLDRGRREDRRRPLGALRRRGGAACPRRVPQLLADEAGGARLRRRRLRPLQVHRRYRRGDAAAGEGRRRAHSRRGFVALEEPGRLGGFVAPAARSGSGSARRWSSEFNLSQRAGLLGTTLSFPFAVTSPKRSKITRRDIYLAAFISPRYPSPMELDYGF